jgi:hypothetical protein
LQQRLGTRARAINTALRAALAGMPVAGLLARRQSRRPRNEARRQRQTMKTYTGHLAIGWENLSDRTLNTYVTPATFGPTGLAIHRAMNGGHGWVVTHVRSSAKLAHVDTRAHALHMLQELSGDDWTFDAGAVTREHAAKKTAAEQSYRRAA